MSRYGFVSRVLARTPPPGNGLRGTEFICVGRMTQSYRDLNIRLRLVQLCAPDRETTKPSPPRQMSFHFKSGSPGGSEAGSNAISASTGQCAVNEGGQIRGQTSAQTALLGEGLRGGWFSNPMTPKAHRFIQSNRVSEHSLRPSRRVRHQGWNNDKTDPVPAGKRLAGQQGDVLSTRQSPR